MRSWYWRATTSGSGRRKTSITSAATAKPAMLTRNALAVSGTPRSAPTRRVGLISIGPMIEPMVEPPTMSPMARPRSVPPLTSAAA